jgi:Zn-dependent peptidase ImmA (M78 family)
MNSFRESSTLPSVIAEEIIKSLQIREPSEIEIMDIAMERGAFVRENILEGSEARLVRKGGVGIITVNSLIPEEGRKRFAIAHELGHFELHAASQLVLCDERDMYVWNEDKAQEIEANRFAASILMPERIFLQYFKAGPPNLDIIKDLAGKFRTTLTATAMRFVQLSSEACAVAITKDDVIKWYEKSQSFDFHIKVGEKLMPNVEVSDIINKVDLSIRPIKVPASAWLAGDIDEDAMLFEHSLVLKNFDIVLSLLWIFDDIRLGRRYDEDEPEFDQTNPLTPEGKRWRWR